jgi:hypothetical protein
LLSLDILITFIFPAAAARFSRVFAACATLIFHCHYIAIAIDITFIDILFSPFSSLFRFSLIFAIFHISPLMSFHAIAVIFFQASSIFHTLFR